MNRSQISGAVIGAAIEVHRQLGPGLLESAYEVCLAHEMTSRRLRFDRQEWLPIEYRGVRLDAGYRVDLLVEGEVIVEIKAVRQVLAIHQAQMLTYLRLSGLHVGLILNFHTLRMKDGIRRFVHELPE